MNRFLLSVLLVFTLSAVSFSDTTYKGIEIVGDAKFCREVIKALKQIEKVKMRQYADDGIGNDSYWRVIEKSQLKTISASSDLDGNAGCAYYDKSLIMISHYNGCYYYDQYDNIIIHECWHLLWGISYGDEDYDENGAYEEDYVVEQENLYKVDANKQLRLNKRMSYR